jgi:hypothetical protein
MRLRELCNIPTYPNPLKSSSILPGDFLPFSLFFFASGASHGLFLSLRGDFSGDDFSIFHDSPPSSPS